MMRCHPDWCGEYYFNGANPRYAACNQDEDFVRGIGDENGQREGRELVGIRPKELAGIQRANRREAWNGGGSAGGVSVD